MDIAGIAQRTDWLQDFRKKYSIAHTFIFQGAIDDYVGHLENMPIRAKDFFINYLMKTRQVVCSYNYSKGLSFASPQMRKIFFDAAGEQAPVASEHEILFPEPNKACEIIEKAILGADKDIKMAFCFEDAELFWPNGDYNYLSAKDRFMLSIIRRWAKSPEFIKKSPVISLWTSTSGDLHESLRQASSLIELINLPFPSFEQRKSFIEDNLKTKQGLQLADNMSSSRFAALTGGLSRVLINDVCLRARAEKTVIDAPLIKSRKDQIIKNEFGDLIEILEPSFGFEAVGGMNEIKQYLNSSIINPLKSEQMKSRIPSGVMLAGPPGTGKTFLVQSLAYEAGISVVKLNAGRLLGQYVGNSERNLEKALASIRALTPTIVMIDEIEQQFQRGGADGSGVERRIFGRILEEMSGTGSTKRGDVIWFAATNRIDLVDAALRRPGRFDRIVPILPPQSKERWDILVKKAPALAGVENEGRTFLLNNTENYTGADIDGLLVKASEIAYDTGKDSVDALSVAEALKVLRPSHDNVQTQKMIDLALQFCNDLSLIPTEWRQKFEQQKQEENKNNNYKT